MINAQLLVQRTLGKTAPQTEETKPIAIVLPEAPKPEKIPEQPAPEVVIPEPMAEFTQPLTEAPQPEPAVQKETVQENVSLQTDTLKVLEENAPAFSEATIRLALLMAENHRAIRDFMSDLRKVAQTSLKEFRFDLNRIPQEERNNFLTTTRAMVGLLSETFYNKTTCVFQGKLSAVPACMKFLNGGYLETAVAWMTREVIREFAESRGLSWKVQQNAIITDGISKNEVDLLLTVDGRPMLVEVKSGSCKTYDKYFFLGQRYKLLPDAMLLVGANISHEEADIVRDFMEYTVCDLSNYREKLIAMLEKNCGGNKNG